MLAWFNLLLATVWTVGVVDAVVESADRGGRTLTAFGRQLFEPGVPAGIYILCGLAASAALALVTTVARVRGRRLERRMAAELDDRVDEVSQRAAGDAARAQLLRHRIAELQTSLDELVARRDEANQELQSTRERAIRLHEAATSQREALRRLTDLSEQQVVQIPDVPRELLTDDSPVASTD
jgi:septal ring factor EnvC (AmiA/AmiB activator)